MVKEHGITKSDKMEWIDFRKTKPETISEISFVITKDNKIKRFIPCGDTAFFEDVKDKKFEHLPGEILYWLPFPDHPNE